MTHHPASSDSRGELDWGLRERRLGNPKVQHWSLDVHTYETPKWSDQSGPNDVIVDKLL